mmetsp:Transcript_23441/g.55318  ORF Transcript_23441/g.55318 Transcript_23441/m.55318 type:complete len:213 (-) Transcript_23441:491-1129(-)
MTWSGWCPIGSRVVAISGRRSSPRISSGAASPCEPAWRREPSLQRRWATRTRLAATEGSRQTSRRRSWATSMAPSSSSPRIARRTPPSSRPSMWATSAPATCSTCWARRSWEPSSPSTTSSATPSRSTRRTVPLASPESSTAVMRTTTTTEATLGCCSRPLWLRCSTACLSRPSSMGLWTQAPTPCSRRPLTSRPVSQETPWRKPSWELQMA